MLQSLVASVRVSNDTRCGIIVSCCASSYIGTSPMYNMLQVPVSGILCGSPSFCLTFIPCSLRVQMIQTFVTSIKNQ